MKTIIYNSICIIFIGGWLISLAIDYPFVAIPIYVLVGVLVLVSIKGTNRKSEQCKSAFDSVFEGADCIPEYEQSWCYSYPSFLLTFPTREARDRYLQSERAGVFSKTIAELCKSAGSSKRP